MKAAGIVVFFLSFSATFILNGRIARHRLPDKPVWGRWTFDSVDEVGRRYLRWQLFFILLMIGDVIMLILTQ
jgi:hypothetical protein